VNKEKARVIRLDANLS
jgi:hypothetical protein